MLRGSFQFAIGGALSTINRASSAISKLDSLVGRATSRMQRKWESSFGRMHNRWIGFGNTIRIGSARINYGLGSISHSAAAMAAVLASAFAVVKIVQFGKTAISVAADFEQAMNVTAAVANLDLASKNGQQALQELSDKAKELGADITLPATSAKDAALAMQELVKGGLSVIDVMGAAKGTLQLAAIAEMDQATAAKIAVGALNAFHLAGTKMVDVTNFLSGAANASTASVQTLADGFSYAAATFAQSGQSAQDLASALGIMANSGIQGSKAGTAVNMMMTYLVNPRNAKAADMIRQLGINVTDATGQFLPLRDIIAQYSEGIAKLNPEQKAQVAYIIGGTRAGRAFNTVMAGGVEQWDKMYDAVTRTGNTTRITNAMMDSLKGALEGLQGVWENLKIVFAEPMLDPLQAEVKMLSQWLADITPQAGQLGTAIAKVMSAFLDLANNGIRHLSHTFQAVMPMITRFTDALSAGEKKGGLAGMLKSINTYLVDFSGELRKSTGTLGRSIASDITGITSGVGNALATMVGILGPTILDLTLALGKSFLTNLVEMGRVLYLWIEPQLPGMLRALNDFFRFAVTWIGGPGIQMLREVISGVGNVFVDFVATSGPTVLRLLGTLADKILGFLTYTVLPEIERLGGVFSTAFVSWFTRSGPTLLADVSKLFIEVFRWLSSTALPLLGRTIDVLGRMLVRWIRAWGPGMLDAIAGVLVSFGKVVLTVGVPLLVSAVSALGRAIIGTLGRYGPQLLSLAGRTIMELAQGFLSIGVPLLASAFRTLGNLAINAIARWGRPILGEITKIALSLGRVILSEGLPLIGRALALGGQLLVGWINTYGPQMLSLALKLFTSLARIILTTALPALERVATSLANTLLNWLPRALPILLGDLSRIFLQIAGWLGSTGLSLIARGLSVVGRSLVSFIANWGPAMLGSLIRIVLGLGQVLLSTGVPLLISAVRTLGNVLVGALAKYGPALLNTSVRLVLELANGFLRYGLPLLSRALSVVGNIVVGAITRWGPQILGTLANIAIGLGRILISTGVPLLIRAVAALGNVILGALSRYGPQLIGIGVTLITELARGFLSVGVPLIARALSVLGGILINAIYRWGPTLLSLATDIFQSLFNVVLRVGLPLLERGVMALANVLLDWIPSVVPMLMTDLLRLFAEIVGWLTTSGIQLLTRALVVVAGSVVEGFGGISGGLIEAIAKGLVTLSHWLAGPGIQMLAKAATWLADALFGSINKYGPILLGDVFKILDTVAGWVVHTGVPLLLTSATALGTALVSWIPAETKTALNLLTSLFNQLTKWLGDTGLSLIETAVVDIGTALIDWVRTDGPGMLDNLTALFNDTVRWLGTTGLTMLEDAVGVLGTILVNWIPDETRTLLDYLSDFMTSATKWLDNTGLPLLEEAVTGLGTALINWISTDGPTMLQNLTTLFNDAFKWLTTSGLTLLEKAAGALGKTIVDWIPGEAKTLLQYLTTFINNATGWLTQTGLPLLEKATGSLADALINWVSDSGDTILTNLSTLFDQIVLWLGDTGVQKLKNGIKALGGTLSDWIVNELPTALDNTSALFESLGQAVTTTLLPNLGTLLTNGSHVLGDWISNHGPVILTTLTNIFTALSQLVRTTILPALGGVMNNGAHVLWGWIKNHLPNVLQEMSRLSNRLVQFITNTVIPNLGKTIDKLAPVLVSWISGKGKGKNKKQGAAGQALDNLSAMFGSIFNLLTQNLLPALGKIVVALAKSMWSWTKGHAKSIKNNVRNALKALGNWIINTGAPNLLAAVKTVGSAMWSWAQGHGPKIKKQIGNAIGSVIAWLKNTGVPAVFAAAQKVGSALMDGIFGTPKKKKKKNNAAALGLAGVMGGGAGGAGGAMAALGDAGAPQIQKSLAERLISALGNAIGEAWKWLTTTGVDLLLSGLDSLTSPKNRKKVQGIASKVGGQIISGLEMGLSNIGDRVGPWIWSKLSKGQQNGLTQMKDSFTDALGGLMDWLETNGPQIKKFYDDNIAPIVNDFIDAFKEMKPILKPLGAFIKGFFKGVWEAIKPVLELGGGALKLLGWLFKHVIGPAIGWLGDLLQQHMGAVEKSGEAIGFVVASLTDFGAGLLGLGTKAFGFIGKTIGSLLKLTKWGKKLKPVTNALKDIGTAFGDLRKDFGKFEKSLSKTPLGKALKGLENTFKRFGKTLADFFLGKAKKLPGSVAGAAGALGGGTTRRVGGLFSNLLKWFQDGFKAVTDWVTKHNPLEKILDLFAGKKTPIYKYKGKGANGKPILEFLGYKRKGGLFGDLETAAKTGMAKFSKTITDALDGVKNKFGDAGSWIKDHTVDAFTTVKNRAGTLLSAKRDSLGSKVSAGLTNVKNAFSDTWTNVGDGITTRWNGFRDTISTKLSGKKDSIGSRVGTGLTNVKNAFSNAWTAVGTRLNNAWNGFRNTIGTKFSGKKDSIASRIGTGLTNAKNAMSGAWTAIGTRITNAWNGFRNTIGTKLSGKKDSIGSHVTNGMNTLKTTMSNAWSRVSTNTVNAWNGIKQTISNTFNGKNGIGKAISNATTGIGNTLKSVWSNFTKWLTDPISKGITGIITSLNRGIRAFNLFLQAFAGAVNFISQKLQMGKIIDTENFKINVIPNPGTWPKNQGAGQGGKTAAHARGTSYHYGGPAIVNEEGPEAIFLPGSKIPYILRGDSAQYLPDLPKGSKVLTAPKTRNMLRSLGNIGGGMTGSAVAALARGVGLTGEALRRAVAIAGAESNWNPDAMNPTSTATGLWQIMQSIWAPGHPRSWLTDPKRNAQFMANIYHDAGNRWTPWETYNNGMYLSWLGRADDALQSDSGNSTNIWDFLKDKAAQVVGWLADKAEFFKNAFGGIGINMPGVKLPGILGKIGAGLFKTLKNGAFDWATSMVGLGTTAAGAVGTSKGGWVKPFSGYYPVTQEFGANKNALFYGPAGHLGIDFGLPVGTGVRAPHNMLITGHGFNAFGTGWGHEVVGMAGNIRVILGHLMRDVVKVGQFVKAGQLVGYSDTTGNATGPHLDMTVMRGNSFFNPRNVLPFANGGIITSPTLGLMGEAGREAVIPLDQGIGARLMAQIETTTARARNLPAADGPIVFNGPLVEIHGDVKDPQEVAKAVQKAGDQFLRDLRHMSNAKGRNN